MTLLKFWNDNAENWAKVIESSLIASRAVTNRALLDEILRLKPKTVLDLGCGEGWLSEPMAQSGIDYIGTDGASKLIEIASAKRKGAFHCANYKQITQGEWSPARSPDLAVFNFSLLDEDLVPLLRRVSGFLSQGGFLVIQTLNPKNLPVYQDGWNEEDFKAMLIPFNGKMPWYGRTIESWHSLFEKCDLKLEKTLEPSMNGKAVSIIFQLQVNSM